MDFGTGNELIVIRGANQHNLKNVDLAIPKNQLVVFTGVSGSGKSSLAFDTIFAEGQRRYVESLSTYARQFLGQLDKPDVESIEGLSPAISIDQKSTNNNPRSTVGTVTEIYDHLRLLYARIGTPHCPGCGSQISPQTIDQIVDNILELEERTKIQIIAPVVRGKKGEYSSLFSELKQEGFVRVRVDSEIYNLDEDEIKLAKTKKHDIDLVVDRIAVKPASRSRIADSVQTALKRANGLVIIDIVEGQEKIYSEKLACEKCQLSFDELSPRMFSFNSPYGACDTCSGLGAHFEISPDLIVPDLSLSLAKGAIYPWAKTGNKYYVDLLDSVCEHYGIRMDIPFQDLSVAHSEIILYGSTEPIMLTYDDFKRRGRKSHCARYEGVIPYFKKRYDSSTSDLVRQEVEKYMTQTPCPNCKGKRLKEFSLAVTLSDKSIADVADMSIKDCHEFMSDLFLKLTNYQLNIVNKLLHEIRERLKFLVDVGLNYLTLARAAGSLSGGEAQRIRLATQIGSGLSGVLYVLDEPSIGLHQVNNDQLLNTLVRLRNLGNTLIVVEHDEETIRRADWVVDIGPKAGIHGGEIMAEGKPEDIVKAADSLTGQYLSGRKCIKIPTERREGNGKIIKIVNANKNNLKNLSVDIPLGKLVSVTGVSGSGKSTLIFDIFHKYLKHKLGKNTPKPQGVKQILGIEKVIDKVIDIDQSPIGRTPRSNPATYTGVFDHIRALFALTNEAKTRGYAQGIFSFNVKGGRCEACKGDGINIIEMNFLPDVHIPCDVCKGARYNRETLEVKYKGKSISDVLNMTVEEALEFFANIPKVANKMQTLYDVGLDYIKLGQSATTLSGGEAQRVKLASELNKRSTGKTLYLLDEPSVGLHWYDLSKLVDIFNRLVDGGNTIVVIEHSLDIIKASDWIIDLGPEGGNAGGLIIGEGTPEDIAKFDHSYTGQYLKKILNNDQVCSI